ncbi:MAG: alcohol dehydrogenase catalytic domain-containing protein [Litorimonas sp.]
MQALVFHGPRDIRHESFPDPELTNPRHAIIEVSHCSICGSDLHLYHGDRIGPFDYSAPQPKFCVGHETIGRVVEVGKDVKTLHVGQRLLVAGGAGCGLCQHCLRGDIRRCTGDVPKLAYGISPLMNGGQAQYLEVFAADATSVPIPDGVSDEQAILMTDAMATGHYGLGASGFEPGDTVCVIGQGPVGLMAAEVAMAKGAARVFTVDPVKARRDLSARFGAEPLAPDQARAAILQATDGQGVDRVVEAVGHVQTITEAVRLARPGGGVGIVGLVQDGDWGGVPILRRAQGKSVRVHAGIANVVDSWPELLGLVEAGKVKGEGVFTHDFALKDGADAYALFDARADGVMKVMIRP